MPSFPGVGRRPPVAAAWLAVALCVAGCGRPHGTVSGRVRFQDQPVAGGSVVLYCADQQIVRGQIGPDGAYSIPNVPRGEVRATVVPPVRLPDGFRKKYPTPPVTDGPVVPGDGRGPKDGPTAAIPARYGIPEESGLATTVVGDATEFDIRLVR